MFPAASILVACDCLYLHQVEPLSLSFSACFRDMVRHSSAAVRSCSDAHVKKLCVGRFAGKRADEQLRQCQQPRALHDRNLERDGGQPAGGLACTTRRCPRLHRPPWSGRPLSQGAQPTLFVPVFVTLNTCAAVPGGYLPHMERDAFHNDGSQM